MTGRDLLRDAHFRCGARDMLAFGPGLAAWGIVTGVAMVQSGLGVWLSVLMSLVVFAGSAQLASLPLIATGAPMWVVWASAFCVNLRFAIFSAQWRRHIGHRARGRTARYRSQRNPSLRRSGRGIPHWRGQRRGAHC
jgi:predicted branched-subunit amino acid permease